MEKKQKKEEISGKKIIRKIQRTGRKKKKISFLTLCAQKVILKKEEFRFKTKCKSFSPLI